MQSYLARGSGLTYNPGERVLGTTAPGYAVLLGGLGYLTDANSIPSISRAVNAIFLLVAGLAASLSTYRLTSNASLGAVVFGLAVLGPYTLFSSVAGMEVSLFLALVATGLFAMISDRRFVASLLFGLTPLIRPEGISLVALVGLTVIIEGVQGKSSQRPFHYGHTTRYIGAARPAWLGGDLALLWHAATAINSGKTGWSVSCWNTI